MRTRLFPMIGKNILLLGLLLYNQCCKATTPLPIEKVLKLQIRQMNQQCSIYWKIQAGYYIYLDSISIHNPTSAGTSKIILPKSDGLMPYQNRYRLVYQKPFSTPLSGINTRKKNQLIQIHFQACSKSGYCYPPQNRELLVYDHTCSRSPLTSTPRPTQVIPNITHVSPNTVRDLLH